MSRRCLLPALLLALILAPLSRADDRIPKLIMLGDFQPAELELMLAEFLSPEGKMRYIASRHGFLVFDHPQNIRKMQKFMQSATLDLPNVRLRLEFENERLVGRQGLGVGIDYGRGQPRGPKVIIEDGRVKKPERVTIDLQHSRVETQENTTQLLMARSGSAARLRVAREIPEPAWLRQYELVPLGRRSGQPLVWAESVQQMRWRDVGSALYVQPTVVGENLIDVEVFPVVTFVDGEGRKRSYRVKEVETKLRVAPGQRVFIGGNNQEMRQYVRQLFGPQLVGKTRNDDLLSIYLTAEIVAAPRR